MRFFTRQALTLLIILLSAQVTSAQTAAEAEAENLANTIRQFNEAFGDVVDGEMTEAQIAQFEKMIAPAFDANKLHIGLCSGLAFTSIVNASVFLNPAMSDMNDELRRELVPGSIRDWLVQFTTPLIQNLGYERTIAAVKNECLQKRYVHAAYPDLNMNSLEMLAAEKCLVERDC